uniref:Aspartyl protease n=1 Tax=Panagrolaimus sp. ES5 TaxID=591445 RepID=A0AC34FI70_9BILA
MVLQTYNVANGIANAVTARIVKSPSCIKITSKDKKFIARVGTGTSLSVCHEKVLETLKIQSYNRGEKTITAPNGHVYHTIGQVQLSILIKNAEVVHDFYVVQQLEEDFLIGNDIMGKFGSISFTDYGKKITFGEV